MHLGADAFMKNRNYATVSPWLPDGSPNYPAIDLVMSYCLDVEKLTQSLVLQTRYGQRWKVEFRNRKLI